MVKKLKLTRAYFALLIALLVLTAAGYAGLIETAIGGPIINPGFYRCWDLKNGQRVPPDAVASGTPMLGTSTTIETGSNSVVVGAGGQIKLKP